LKQPTAADIRASFRYFLTHNGHSDVVLTVDGVIEVGEHLIRPSITQVVIVMARGMKPTRFTLHWDGRNWWATRVGSKNDVPREPLHQDT